MAVVTADIEGVGLSYHPLLHEALLSRRLDFDFVEIGLDHYVNCARFPLLDSEEARLHEITEATPCIWQGSVLSLGSVEASDDPSPDPRLIEHIQRLLETTRARSYCETIGFRRLAGRDLGQAQNLPHARTAAQWVAARYKAARDALGFPFLLELPAAAVLAPQAEWDAMTFLREVVLFADARFMLDVSDLTRLAAEAKVDPFDMASGLPFDRIAAVVISGDSEEDWALLAKLVAVDGERKPILIRRRKNLFPIDGIGRNARRAKELLPQFEGRGRDHTARPAGASTVAQDELAALRAYQAEFIDCCLDAARGPPASLAGQESQWATLRTGALAWQAWQARLEDMHKARQIRQFLANDI